MSGVSPSPDAGGIIEHGAEETAAARAARSRRRRGGRRPSPHAEEGSPIAAEFASDAEVPAAEGPENDMAIAEEFVPVDAVVEPAPSPEQAIAPAPELDVTSSLIDLRQPSQAGRPERGPDPWSQGNRDQRNQHRGGQQQRPFPRDRNDRPRQAPLPAGVPSAAALDEVEPVRAPAPPRAEPSGDLALLLGGFEDIQQKNTDRLLAALRQSLVNGEVGGTTRPQSPSERVGVFVDVPNLVYAARFLSRYIDFGRMLDRLLAGRRLVRAQAYSPTDPDPSAEQQFLSPVRSQGFRVTTKNYRTFASGAKKADMDLDLCMDVVRLVVARSIDCVVLASGDGDFMPLIEFCSDYGVRVEVASFAESTSEELRQGCDRFYNLSTMEGIRLARPLATP